MSTHTPDPPAAPAVAHTRWRIDPNRSDVEFHSRPSAAGHSIPLDAEGTLRFTEGTADVEVTALADHTQLGMTFSGLGMLRPTSKLTVRGQLAPTARSSARIDTPLNP